MTHTPFYNFNTETLQGKKFWKENATHSSSTVNSQEYSAHDIRDFIQTTNSWENLREQVPDSLIKSLANYTIPLATEATKYLNQKLDFFDQLPASQKAEIQFIVQIAIAQFVDWAEAHQHTNTPELQYTNPNSTLVRLLSMQQAVEITRNTLEFFEHGIIFLANSPQQADVLKELVLRYGWEVGFATATAYARVAESRGTLDSRLEASLIDGIIRNEDHNSLFSQAAALNINTQESLSCIALCLSATNQYYKNKSNDIAEYFLTVQDLAKTHNTRILGGLHGNRLIIVIFGDDQKNSFIKAIKHVFPYMNIVIGDTVPGLLHASEQVQAVISAMDALPAWPDAPCPIFAAELLPERALLGETVARQEMITRFVQPIREAGPMYVETIDKFLENSSVELTAADLFVHQNTIRYRLKKIADLNGLDVFNNRDVFTLRMAFLLSRLEKIPLSSFNTPSHLSHP